MELEDGYHSGWDEPDIREWIVLWRQVEHIMVSLTDQEAKVVALSLGLSDGRSRTNKLISQELGIPYRKVSRVLNSGLHKLRNPMKVFHSEG